MKKFRESLLELKNLRTLTLTAMLIALWIGLDRFSILILPTIKIKLTFIPFAFISAMFGPFVGMLSGFITEMVSFFISPQGGAFFPGFSLSAAFTGIIYGMFLYKRPITLKNTFMAKALVNIFINIGVNTYWLSILQGEAIRVLLPVRAVKNLVLLPFEAILMYITLKSLMKIYDNMKKR